MISASAFSSNVSVIAQGVFAEYTDPDKLLPFSEPAPGTVFTLRFTYDSTVMDTVPFADFGLYPDAILAISLSIGGEMFGMLPDANDIIVLDDVNQPCAPDCTDQWFTSTRIRTPTGIEGEEISEGFGLNLFTNGDLPVPPLNSDALVAPSWPSSWGDGAIFYSIILDTGAGSEQLAVAYSNITSISIVPLPAAGWLFGSALGLIGWMKRRHA